MNLRHSIVGVCLGVLTLAATVSPSQAADDRLEKIKDRGVLRACAVNYVPWNIKNPATNEWEGINIEIAREIAKGLEVEIEFIDSAWSTVIQSVDTDKCDIAVAALWTAPARAEVVLFTRPVGGDGMTLFVPADSTAKSPADIDKPGNVVVVLSGSSDEKAARELFKQAEVKSLVTDKAGAQILDVATGRADAASGALVGNSQFIKSNPNIKVKPLEGFVLNYTPFAFALPVGEYHFLNYVNVVLNNLDASGKLQQIKDKWTKIEN